MMTSNAFLMTKLALIAGLLAWGREPVQAHHAFAAEFSAERPVSLNGTITKVAWLNPHARFFVSVKDPRGASAMWELVLGSPNVLMRRGWTRTTLKEGDSVTVNGYAARGGSRLAAARSIRFADGRALLFGSDNDGGPEK